MSVARSAFYQTPANAAVEVGPKRGRHRTSPQITAPHVEREQGLSSTPLNLDRFLEGLATLIE